MKKITILGLGAMGQRMAIRLLNAGYDVTVYNRTKSNAQAVLDTGASWADTPKDAVLGAEIVLSMVTDDDASKAIWLDPPQGAIHQLSSQTIVIESSTVTHEWAKTLGNTILEKGAEFLDAPVLGSRPQAEAGQLIFLVGGAVDTFEKVQSTLLNMGGKALHVGPLGSGMVMKLAANALFGVQTVILSEVLTMAQKSGLALEKAVEVLNATPLVSPAMQGMSGLFLKQAFAPLFPIDLVEKDFGYVVKTAKQLDMAIPVAEATQTVYRQAQENGYGHNNISGVFQVYQ